MKKTLVTTAIASVFTMTSMTAIAAGDPEVGATKITTCMACHGKDGKGIMPTYPNLNGQNEQYLINSIKAYRNGERTGGTAAVMIPMARIIQSEKDIEDIAAYYSNQP